LLFTRWKPLIHIAEGLKLPIALPTQQPTTRLAEIAQRELQEEESELSTAQHKTNHDY
jgi:hypothetical protein